MLLTIIIKEIRNNLLNTRISICYAAVVALTLFAIVSSGLRYRHEFDKAQKNVGKFDKQMAEEQEKGWWSDYNIQIPPRPLAVLGQGFNREIARPYHVGISFAAVKPLGSYIYKSPIFRIFDVFDLATITTVILSLLALFISFDAVSLERESGTLRLLMANPIPKGTYILGKTLGGYLTVIFPYVLSLFAGMLFLIWGMGLTFTASHYARLGIFIGLTMAYLAVFFFISMLLSVMCKRSATALFASLCIWIGLVFVIPYMAAWAGKKISPFDTTAQTNAVLRRIVNEENEAARKEHKQYRGTKEQDSMARKIWGEAHVRMGERWDVYFDVHKENVRRQVRTGATLARTSPAAAFLLAGTTVFRTGIYDFLDAERWKEELTVKSKKIADDFNNRQRKLRTEWRAKKDDTKFVGETFDLKSLPKRRYDGLDTAAGLRLILPDLLVLLLESVVLFMAAFVMFIRKTDV